MKHSLKLVVLTLLIVSAAVFVGCGGGGGRAVTSPTSSGSIGPPTTLHPAQASPAQGAALLGDLDGDGNPTVGDAIKILRIVVGLDPDGLCADANRNGQTDVGDAIKVLRCVVGLDEWPMVLYFSGLTWNIKCGQWGPRSNYWSASEDNVWVDAEGLHLKITNREDQWQCAEVWTQESFGYKEYMFHVASGIDHLDKNVVAGLFIYKSDTEEIDIEFSRWGNADKANNGQYVVQPAWAGCLLEFPVALNDTYSTHRFIWDPSRVIFQSIHGHYNRPPRPSYDIQTWVYDGNPCPMPTPSTEKVHINLWLMDPGGPSDGQPAELIVRGVSIADPPTNHSPTASAADISGQPSVMHLGGEYSVTAKYSDPDGATDLRYCYLQLRHPTKPLTLMWNRNLDLAQPWDSEEGANYITLNSLAKRWLYNGECLGCELTWTFTIDDSWPTVENAIDFGVYAEDDSGLASGWAHDDSNTSFGPG